MALELMVVLVVLLEEPPARLAAETRAVVLVLVVLAVLVAPQGVHQGVMIDTIRIARRMPLAKKTKKNAQRKGHFSVVRRFVDCVGGAHLCKMLCESPGRRSLPHFVVASHRYA